MVALTRTFRGLSKVNLCNMWAVCHLYVTAPHTVDAGIVQGPFVPKDSGGQDATTPALTPASVPAYVSADVSENSALYVVGKGTTGTVIVAHADNGWWYELTPFYEFADSDIHDKTPTWWVPIFMPHGHEDDAKRDIVFAAACRAKCTWTLTDAAAVHTEPVRWGRDPIIVSRPRVLLTEQQPGRQRGWCVSAPTNTRGVDMLYTVPCGSPGFAPAMLWFSSSSFHASPASLTAAHPATTLVWEVFHGLVTSAETEMPASGFAPALLHPGSWYYGCGALFDGQYIGIPYPVAAAVRAAAVGANDVDDVSSNAAALPPHVLRCDGNDLPLPDVRYVVTADATLETGLGERGEERTEGVFDVASAVHVLPMGHGRDNGGDNHGEEDTRRLPGHCGHMASGFTYPVADGMLKDACEGTVSVVGSFPSRAQVLAAYCKDGIDGAKSLQRCAHAMFGSACIMHGAPAEWRPFARFAFSEVLESAAGPRDVATKTILAPMPGSAICVADAADSVSARDEHLVVTVPGCGPRLACGRAAPCESCCSDMLPLEDISDARCLVAIDVLVVAAAATCPATAVANPEAGPPALCGVPHIRRFVCLGGMGPENRVRVCGDGATGGSVPLFTSVGRPGDASTPTLELWFDDWSAYPLPLQSPSLAPSHHTPPAIPHVSRGFVAVEVVDVQWVQWAPDGLLVQVAVPTEPLDEHQPAETWATPIDTHASAGVVYELSRRAGDGTTISAVCVKVHACIDLDTTVDMCAYVAVPCLGSACAGSDPVTWSDIHTDAALLQHWLHACSSNLVVCAPPPWATPDANTATVTAKTTLTTAIDQDGSGTVAVTTSKTLPLQPGAILRRRVVCLYEKTPRFGSGSGFGSGSAMPSLFPVCAHLRGRVAAPHSSHSAVTGCCNVVSTPLSDAPRIEQEERETSGNDAVTPQEQLPLHLAAVLRNGALDVFAEDGTVPCLHMDTWGEARRGWRRPSVCTTFSRNPVLDHLLDVAAAACGQRDCGKDSAAAWVPWFDSTDATFAKEVDVPRRQFLGSR